MARGWSNWPREYAERGVRVIGHRRQCAGFASQEIAKYASDHGITFPVLIDTGNTVADKFGAARTPEVYLLDEQARRSLSRPRSTISLAQRRKRPSRLGTIWRRRSTSCWPAAKSRSPSCRRQVALSVGSRTPRRIAM